MNHGSDPILLDLENRLSYQIWWKMSTVVEVWENMSFEAVSYAHVETDVVFVSLNFLDLGSWLGPTKSSWHDIRAWFCLQVSQSFLKLLGPSNQLMNLSLQRPIFSEKKCVVCCVLLFILFSSACLQPAPQKHRFEHFLLHSMKHFFPKISQQPLPEPRATCPKRPKNIKIQSKFFLGGLYVLCVPTLPVFSYVFLHFLYFPICSYTVRFAIHGWHAL